jgi:tetratricopeptide (TPR) repeat protein
MNKRIIPVILTAVVLIVILFCAGFILKRDHALSRNLEQSKQLFRQMEDKLTESQAEAGRLSKESEKLQEASVSYLALNTKFREENERLQKRLEESQKIIETRESELERARQNLEKAQEKMSRGTDEKISQITQQKEALESRLAALEKNLQQERGLYHYNLAVAYTRAKLYPEAEAAYLKSLQYDEKNGDAHYNLALLYQNVRNDPGKAAEHYQRYLDLKPDAQDAGDIRTLIEKLKQ